MKFFSTRQVALILGVKPASLAKAIWDGRLEPPDKGPSGNFLWQLGDIERASWVMRRRSFEGLTEGIEVMLSTGSNIVVGENKGSR